MADTSPRTGHALLAFLGLNRGIAGLLSMVILIGMGERMAERFLPIYLMAPEGRKAAMFGLYYLLRDVVVSVAAFGGAFLWILSPTVNFLAAFAFGTAGTVWFIFFGKDDSPENTP